MEKGVILLSVVFIYGIIEAQGVDTLISEDFESCSLPSGWISQNGGGNGFIWEVADTGATNPPPSSGTCYAIINYTDKTQPDTDYLVSPKRALQPAASSLTLSYSWGLKNPAEKCTLFVEVRFFSGGSWGSYDTLNFHTQSGSGDTTLDLSSYLPADSVQLRWGFYSPDGKRNPDAEIDNVFLVEEYTMIGEEEIHPFIKGKLGVSSLLLNIYVNGNFQKGKLIKEEEILAEFNYSPFIYEDKNLTRRNIYFLEIEKDYRTLTFGPFIFKFNPEENFKVYYENGIFLIPQMNFKDKVLIFDLSGRKVNSIFPESSTEIRVKRAGNYILYTERKKVKIFFIK